jgi:hypothetical protein
MQLLSEHDNLTVRSSSSEWEAIRFISVLTAFMLHSVARDGANSGRGLLTCVVLILACLYWARPRKLVAQFVLDDQRVTFAERLGYCARVRSWSFPFADIASLGAQERRTRLVCDYLPVIKLKDGRSLRLSTVHGSAREVGNLVESLCTTLKLKRVDSQARTSWWTGR